MLPTKFRKIWLSGFRGEDFLEINQSKTKIVCDAIFVYGSRQNEQSIQKTFHRCFLPSFGSFGPAVSEKKIFLNWPIRKKNHLWQSCLFTDRDEMSNLYRGPSTDASHQVSVHLAEGFHRRRLKCERLTDDRRQVMAKAHIAFGKVS